MAEIAAPVAPRPAATVLLLRDGTDAAGAASVQVLMLARHAALKFAAGALVFPGGSIDPGDGAIATDPTLCARCDTPPAEAARRVAAIRETWEEAGILLARPQPAAVSRGGDLAQALRAAGLRLAPDLLLPFAHWITPRPMPRRFDTYFYLARAPAGQLAAADGGESVAATWMSPREAVALAEAGQPMVFATEMNLRLLAALGATVDAVFAAAAARRIVTVLPEITTMPDGRLMRIPEEAGYGGSEFFARNPPAI
ncbi:MAG: NUDIX hydrolase [Rhodospirillales bacterium]|nr:NUDIX hydrolase [Rhodospirillales bacterium]